MELPGLMSPVPLFAHISAVLLASYSRPEVSINFWFAPKCDCAWSPMLVTDIVRMMNSPCASTTSNWLLRSPACWARVMLSTRNSNLPSRTDDPAGAAVGSAGAADDTVIRLDVLLELDDELEV